MATSTLNYFVALIGGSQKTATLRKMEAFSRRDRRADPLIPKSFEFSFPSSNTNALMAAHGNIF
jgi:hypothetical protein